MSCAVEADQRGRRNCLLQANDNSSVDKCWRPRNFCSLTVAPGESRGSQKVPTDGRELISTTEDHGADSDGLGHTEPAGIF